MPSEARRLALQDRRFPEAQARWSFDLGRADLATLGLEQRERLVTELEQWINAPVGGRRGTRPIVFDVDQEQLAECHAWLRDGLHLRAELAGDEADGHDPVLLGGVEEPLAGPFPGRFVLERHLVEALQGIADVRLVVDRQAPSSPRIHVREGALGQPRAFPGAELAHELPVRPGVARRKVPYPDDVDDTPAGHPAPRERRFPPATKAMGRSARASLRAWALPRGFGAANPMTGHSRGGMYRLLGWPGPVRRD
jgi:hypothetical protein